MHRSGNFLWMHGLLESPIREAAPEAVAGDAAYAAHALLAALDPISGDDADGVAAQRQRPSVCRRRVGGQELMAHVAEYVVDVSAVAGGGDQPARSQCGGQG